MTKKIGMKIRNLSRKDLRELVYLDHSVELPVGPVHQVLEHRQGVRVQQVLVVRYHLMKIIYI